MNQTEYLESRVDDQIGWYGEKSKLNKRAYRTLRTIELVAATSIPLIAGFSESVRHYPVVIGLIGFCVAAVAGILSIFQYQENWVLYRATCEALKREKVLFQTGTSPYDSEDAFPKFVDRVEALLGGEHDTWKAYAGRKREAEA